MRKSIAILVVVAVAFAMALPAFAERKTVEDYGTPAAKTVGEAAKGTAETAVSPVVAFWRWMTGKDKGEKVVTDPVNKTGETIYNAAVNAGETVTGQGEAAAPAATETQAQQQ